ncbi:MAG TPA: N-acetyltransferase [Chlorobaculum parvum]|uniref:N-acetyltransferase n=1 Tax=Chlorobaculum parvum TaxID=274539 RepID=A0A7C5HR47_9CHLB|nr:N-acetyltransferase [Chlorobaculum parvum]
MLIAETERLLIREFESSDKPALSKILGDPEVMEFSSKGALTEADTARFVESCRHSYQKFGYGQWALIEKKSEKLIGFCGLSHATVNGVEEVEVAYRLAKERWENGLSTEAAQKVLEHGFSVCHIKSVVGIVSPRHKASMRVLEKCGFQSFSETHYCGWEARVYRMSDHDWKSYNNRT